MKDYCPIPRQQQNIVIDGDGMKKFGLKQHQTKIQTSKHKNAIPTTLKS